MTLAWNFSTVRGKSTSNNPRTRENSSGFSAGGLVAVVVWAGVVWARSIAQLANTRSTHRRKYNRRAGTRTLIEWTSPWGSVLTDQIANATPTKYLRANLV